MGYFKWHGRPHRGRRFRIDGGNAPEVHFLGPCHRGAPITPLIRAYANAR
jgi:hypothetical protein